MRKNLYLQQWSVPTRLMIHQYPTGADEMTYTKDYIFLLLKKIISNVVRTQVPHTPNGNYIVWNLFNIK